MNIKIRMPKIWRKIDRDGVANERNGVARELLLTFIGTTMSIVLTFGTAQYLEQKQLRADGRQTAMMVIHDMEDCAERFAQYAKHEEERFKAVQHVIEQQNRINAISRDTLLEAYYYITQSTRTDLYTYDDSNEKLFLSSQDVWKSINNATFMDVAQGFFYARRNAYGVLNASGVFNKPVSYDELMNFVQMSNSLGFDFVGYLSKYLNCPDVVSYMKGFQQRVRELNQFSSSMQESAKRCKFLMDISDAELKSYLAQRKHGGHLLKKKKVVGTWVEKDDIDEYKYMEFKDDNTLLSYNIYRYAHPYFVGRMDFKYVNSGTWEIKDDSLIMCLDNEFEWSIDTSHIHILPGKEKEMRSEIAGWYDQMKAQQEELAQTDTVFRNSWAAFMDRSGEKIEAWRVDEETGEEACFYLIKKEL